MLTRSQNRPDPQSDETKKLVDHAKRLVDEGPDKPLFDVLFLNENEGFVVGAFNFAMRTRDGGKTWESISDRTSNPEAYHLYSLTSSKDRVFLAGEHGLLRRWNAELERFETLPSPYQGSYFGIIAQESDLFAFGMRGNAFRSKDGGRSWDKLDTRSVASINGGVALTDKRIVLATQGGALLVSEDQGATFSQQPAPMPLPCAGVAAAGDNAVVVVGSFGVRVEAIR
ncbi:MAG: YCF48-related protein [Gemmatimonadota bacterium]|nr:YCF48-related protein [Gemmatimonadota bacterium]